MNIFIGILIPFIGTTLGAAFVFLTHNDINLKIQKGLFGFASGIMVAASVWSLIIPAIDRSQHMGRYAFVPAASGVFMGMALLLLSDRIVPQINPGSVKPGCGKKASKLVFAVTIHNIPEGVAVGVAFAGVITNGGMLTLAGAMALSLGIAIQNIPEGAIVSLPLKAGGHTRLKSFLYGTLSGAVEPAAAGITLFASSLLSSMLPYLLSFAAGAMLYVVAAELIPEAAEGEHTDIGTIGFGIGFIIMMVLDVVLG